MSSSTTIAKRGFDSVRIGLLSSQLIERITTESELPRIRWDTLRERDLLADLQTLLREHASVLNEIQQSSCDTDTSSNPHEQAMRMAMALESASEDGAQVPPDFKASLKGFTDKGRGTFFTVELSWLFLIAVAHMTPEQYRRW